MSYSVYCHLQVPNDVAQTLKLSLTYQLRKLMPYHSSCTLKRTYIHTYLCDEENIVEIGPL